MPFSFPSSPAIGEQSTQNGRTYEWTGSAWQLVAVPSGLTVGTVIEDPPNDGNTYGRKYDEWVDLEQATSLQFRQGTDAERLAMSPVPASGEPIYTTDTKRLYVGDGTTVGGRSVWMGDTSAYIVCQPGDDIQAKYAAAKLLTPNGAALSATNRATLLVMPGVYSIAASGGTVGGGFSVGLLLDADFVDVIGVGAQKWRPSFYLSGIASVGIVANDVTFSGCYASTYAGTGGTNRNVVNCAGIHVYVCTVQPQVDGIPNVYAGTVVGCYATTNFGGITTGSTGAHVFTGSAIECVSDFYFFRNVLFQGAMRRCVAVGMADSFNQFRSMQGRIEYCGFPQCATANLPGRSTDYGIAPAAFTGTCTISQASPAVVTKSSHGLRSGWRIRFSTTGTLPSGLDASTTYYVRYIDANSFSVAATVAGTLINTTTAGSGDHSIVIPPGVEGGRYSYCTTSDGEYTTP